MRSLGAFAVIFLALAQQAQAAPASKCGAELSSDEQRVFAAESAKLDSQEVARRRDRLKKARLDHLVCSDDELSDLNSEMNSTYWAAMKRAGRYNTAALRYDQREFEEELWQGADSFLSGAAVSGDDSNDSRKAAIKDLKERMKDRIRVLKAYEPEREDFEGEWRSESGRVDITKDGAGYKVSVAIGAGDGVRRGCRVEGTARIEDGDVIADTEDANKKQRRMRMRLKGGGLAGEILDAGDGDLCIRGEEMDRTVYFIPVKRGTADADEKKDDEKEKSVDRGNERSRRRVRNTGPGGLLGMILPTRSR
jgi:hypothetical protein